MNTSGARRLNSIPPGTEVEFTFDGLPYRAAETDTIASALIGAGIRVFGTNPHDGAPYGGYCFVGRCGECQVVVNGQPGVFACQRNVVPGMRVEAQNRRGHWDNGTES